MTFRRRLTGSPIQACLVFLASLSVFTLFLHFGIDPYDEGITLMGAERLFHGEVPHRDFYTLYGPLPYTALATLFTLFGHSMLVERVGDAVLRAAAATLVFLIVARAGSKPAAWGAALAAVISLAAFLFPGHVMIPALCLILASVTFLWPVLDGGVRQRWRLFMAGLCTGACMMCRYDVGAAFLGVQSLLLMTQAAWKPADGRVRQPEIARTLWHDVGRMIAPFLAGALLLPLPTAVAVLACGAGRDLLFQVVTLAPNYVAMRSLPFPDWQALRIDLMSWSVYLAPLILLAAGVVLAARRRHCLLPWPELMLAGALAVLVAKAYVRISGVHMLAATVAALALLGVLWARTATGRWMLVLPTAAAVLWVVPVVPREIRQMQDGLQWLGARGACPTADIPRLSCLALDPPRLEALRFIRRHTQPDDPVFVGAGRHDKIFANDMIFPFLAERPSATKWQQMDPGLQTTRAIQLEMIGELRRVCPRYAVLDTEWDAMRESNASAASSGVTLLDAYLRTAFHAQAVFGPISVLGNVSGCSAGQRR